MVENNFDNFNLEFCFYLFNKNEISVEAKEKFISLINECEIARYAPSSNKNQKMTSILEEAEKIIVNVEANLK